MTEKSNKPRQFDIYHVQLEPAVGCEMKKARPCVILSPNEMNRHLSLVVIAPLSSKVKHYPFHVQLTFKGIEGEVNLEHIRSVDKSRLVTYLGRVDDKTADAICQKLNKMFVRKRR